jgi:pyruvate kinase
MINGHKENIAIPPIIAKIETKKGANYVSEIANVADAILLGRGDLLLDTGPFDFYKIQKKVISTVFELNKPLIIGTDLLPSLSENWLPNRSELAHLCYLFEKGVDAVLLSHETTVGKHPLRTIEIIDGLRQNYETNSIRSIFAPR